MVQDVEAGLAGTSAQLLVTASALSALAQTLPHHNFAGNWEIPALVLTAPDGGRLSSVSTAISSSPLPLLPPVPRASPRPLGLIATLVHCAAGITGFARNLEFVNIKSFYPPFFFGTGF